MRHCNNILPGVFLPVVSLEELAERLDPEADSPTFDIPDSAPHIDELIAHSQAVKAVGAFLSSLPARDRDILHRIFWNEETQASVASRLGVSKMAISKALARIEKTGREALAGYEDLAHIH